MERKPNRVREKLKRGELVTGGVLGSWSPNVMEVAGYAGLDFMRIDSEHSWRQDESLEHVMRAAVVAGIVPIVRVDRENPYLIRKALEAGAGGILVPDCHSAEEATDVVRAAKFPPRGRRGFVGSCWSNAWGSAAGAEWVRWSDTEPMIGVMIENGEAENCVDDIVAVEGLDFVLFGPMDYSMSVLGRPDKEHPRVQDALKKTIAAARKVGKPVMFGVGVNLDEIQKYADMGVSMFEMGADLYVINSVWSKTAAAVAEMGATKK